jgi:hypothetical protein
LSLIGHCMHTLSENQNLKRAVGIAVDASSTVSGRKGGSEDVLALEVETWTEELKEELRGLVEQFDIMNPERVKRGTASTQEFPQPPPHSAPSGLNRKQRRAFESDRRRKRKRQKEGARGIKGGRS